MTALSLAAVNEVFVPIPDIAIVPATPAHVRELTDHLRTQDRREIENYGISCDKGVWRTYKYGMSSKTAIIKDRVAACWGCGGTLLGQTGRPWLLTTDAIHFISPLRFAKIYQSEVYSMLGIFPHLENYVDAEYEGAIRLLSIVGFTIHDPQKIGNGMFRKFEMRAQNGY